MIGHFFIIDKRIDIVSMTGNIFLSTAKVNETKCPVFESRLSVLDLALFSVVKSSFCLRWSKVFSNFTGVLD